MATEDISRYATARLKRYDGVRMQMGRVTTDDDFNESERLVAEVERRTRIDVIGPSGSADQGLAISPPRINAKGDLDFDIGAGTFYIGGLRLETPAETYALQDDWLQQPATARAAPTYGRTDLVYVEAWQQPVEAVEDSELFETALGGPDTSTRVRTMHRVRVAAGIVGTDCASAWEQQIAALAGTCGTLDPLTSECVPDTTLTVTFDAAGVTTDLCSPSVVGGYLGAENQAIRVQIVDSTHFTWGFDNASPLYRVTVGAGLKTITLQTEPKDQAHWMQAGAIVEILPWSAVLSNNEKLAEIRGHLSAVAAAYDPNLRTLTLATPVPTAPAPGFGRQWTTRADAPALGGSVAPYYFMRVWGRGSDTTSAPAIAFVPGTPVTLGNTGLRVTFAGSVFVPGDFWVIAARPADPTGVVPWDLLQKAPPHGIHRFYAPLAFIHWSVQGSDTTGTTVSDCRWHFDPLIRRQTCCTFTVGDGVQSHGNYTRIQDAIDHLPTTGGCVCILPGRYDQDFRIDLCRGVTVEGCGRRTVIRGDPNGTAIAIVSVIDSEWVTLRNFAVVSNDRIPVQLVDRKNAAQLGLPDQLAKVDAPGAVRFRRAVAAAGLKRARLERLSIQTRDMCGVVVAGGQFIELFADDISVRPLARELDPTTSVGRWPAAFIAADDVLMERCQVDAIALAEANAVAGAFTVRSRLALGGIQIAGGSERVEIRRNRIAGGTGNGITLGSVAFVPQKALDEFAATGNFLVLVKAWRILWPGFGIVVDENGCIHLVPNPQPPNDPAGNPLVPVSAGALSDIRILDNEIARMGQSGIAVARFFDLSREQQFITVDRLTIDYNRIHDCLRAELLEITGALAGFAAYGAIALADGELITIRWNEIERNGIGHVDPVCGIFVLQAAALLIEGNRVRDNAPRTQSAAQARPGLRGGIVVALATMPLDVGSMALLQERAFERFAFMRTVEVPSAARIHDNDVLCQEGQALILRSVGTSSVARNALTSRGVTGLAMALPAPGREVALVGGSLPLLGGAVVIENLGFSSEVGVILSFANMKYAEPTVAGRLALLQPTGPTLFAENQVLLDLLGRQDGFLMSSVLIGALDDVAVVDNQLAFRADVDVVIADLFVAAWSLRMTSNRMTETIQHAFVSALAFAVLCTASLNQSTHCVIALSLLGAVGLVASDNLSLLDAFSRSSGGPAICPGGR